MRMVRPQLEAPQVTIAEDQEQFKPITAALVYHSLYPAVQTERGPLNAIVLAFRPNDRERALLAAGEDVYISLLTFLQPMPGILVYAGKRDAAIHFRVPEEC